MRLKDIATQFLGSRSISFNRKIIAQRSYSFANQSTGIYDSSRKDNQILDKSKNIWGPLFTEGLENDGKIQS